jgi:hypothetical protein
MFGNNGVMFGMDGPNMEGTWYNPQTGDSFTVRNSFFEDNQYIVQTMDGRVLNYNQIQNYVKADRPIEVQKPEQNMLDALPAEVAGLIDETYGDLEAEAMSLIAPKPLGNLAQPTPTPTPTPIMEVSPRGVDSVVIERALNKCSLPNLQVGIEWDNFPVNEVKFLIDVMDVDLDDVISYYLNKVDIESTTKMIHEVLRSHIESHFIKEEPAPVVEEKPKAPNNGSSKKMGGPKTPKGPKATKSKKPKVDE